LGEGAIQFQGPLKEYVMRKFVIAALLSLALFVPTAASAEVYVQNPGNTPRLTGSDSGGSGTGTEVQGRQYVRDDSPLGFALTGSDLAGLAVLALLLIGTGYVLVRVRRSGSAPHTA
jgi:hypothetical protein